MKIAVCSDLHLEFGDINLKNEDNADVLILSGDIMVAQHLYENPEMSNTADQVAITKREGISKNQMMAQRFRDFLKRCSFQFPSVIYIAGNHEFYHGRFHAGINYLRDECAKYPNIHFLENNSVTIQGVTFVGCTLWTDMNKGDPTTLYTVKDMMNDFRIIHNDKKEYCRLSPLHVLERHRESMKYIKSVVDGKSDQKFVVVGHHAPSKLSTKPRYQNDYHMNGAYSSDLSEFILDRPQIKLWTHGHTHSHFDYMVGNTRVFCNPRGYDGYEACADEFVLRCVEV